MAHGAWLDEAEDCAWRAHLAMHAGLTARLHRDLQQRCDLSLADYDVLVALTDADQPRLRLFELGGTLQWEKSRLSKQVARMTTRGLIAREECLEDRRGSFVVLTGKGRAAIEAAAPGHAALVRRLVFDALTPRQVEAWGQVSRAVLAQLEDESDRTENTEPPAPHPPTVPISKPARGATATPSAPTQRRRSLER